jgi:uncharacterized protein (TIGR03083 family)
VDDVLAAVADERRRVADLVEYLSPAQLETPSLCGDWTVKQVAGHLLAAVDSPPTGLLPMMLRSGFNLHRANARIAQLMADRPADKLADALRRNAENPFKPPIVGYPGQLTDLQVHGQDMRRPLGLPHGLHLDRLRISLDFLVARLSWLCGCECPCTLDLTDFCVGGLSWARTHKSGGDEGAA